MCEALPCENCLILWSRKILDYEYKKFVQYSSSESTTPGFDLTKSKVVYMSNFDPHALMCPGPRNYKNVLDFGLWNRHYGWKELFQNTDILILYKFLWVSKWGHDILLNKDATELKNIHCET